MKRKILFAVLAAGGCLIMAFAPDKPKKLFVLGDSISLQYGPFLEKDLAGQFLIERKKGGAEAFKNLDIPNGANGGDSRMVLNYLTLKAEDKSFKPDVLLLNCGLHDIKRDKVTDSIAVGPDEYRKNLENIYRILLKKQIPVIWVRTTEVVDSIHAKNPYFRRYARDVEQYNTIADEVFGRYQVAEIDLYNFTRKLGEKRFADHVHYNDEVKALQAAYISGFLQIWKKEHIL
jgi:lysophospholipase L1-like esterase